MLLFVAVAAAASECPPSLAALVPDDLAKMAADDRAAGLPGKLRCAFAEIRPSIAVVAYTESDIGAVRAVRTGETPTVLFEVPKPLIGGNAPGVEAMDVDADGMDEAFVSFGTSRGLSIDRIFRWDGKKLLSLGPVASGRELTLTDVEFVDLHGDGKLSIVDHAVHQSGRDSDGNPMLEAVFTMYSLSDGVYSGGRSLLLFTGFIRGTGDPAVQSQVTYAEGECRTSMIVTSGDPREASTRPTDVEVTLNGATIVRTGELTNAVRAITKPVTFRQGANTVTVKMSGGPQSKVNLLVPACSTTAARTGGLQ